MPDDDPLRFAALEKKIEALEMVSASSGSLHPHGTKTEAGREGGFTEQNARTVALEGKVQTLEKELAARKVETANLAQRLASAEHLLANVARVLKPTGANMTWGSGTSGGTADWEANGTC